MYRAMEIKWAWSKWNELLFLVSGFNLAVVHIIVHAFLVQKPVDRNVGRNDLMGFTILYYQKELNA